MQPLSLLILLFASGLLIGTNNDHIIALPALKRLNSLLLVVIVLAILLLIKPEVAIGWLYAAYGLSGLAAIMAIHHSLQTTRDKSPQ
ncbi:hypothetical protein [Loigolactobacillus zhaoyuanensis]|uniref:Uncharacterized protein n=1 Tax=Loigolactobacillus zhaoyuanensis TaxID=2486017 RepID=A0ABW8U9S5_9LACO|nr:hypothetical protein [Loigolactobacillus zhaoyuanensis]